MHANYFNEMGASSRATHAVAAMGKRSGAWARVSSAITCWVLITATRIVVMIRPITRTGARFAGVLVARHRTPTIDRIASI